MLLVALVVAGSAALASSLSCTSNNYSIQLNGTTYFSVNSANGTCFCRSFVAESFYGGGTGLTGLTAVSTSFNGSSVNASQVTTVQAALEALYSGGAGTTAAAVQVLSAFPAAPVRGQMFLDANTSDVYMWSGSQWRQMVFAQRQYFSDDFAGSSLGPQWRTRLGTTTGTVSGGVWTITDTSIPGETKGWIYDADCGRGIQAQWPMPIGFNDFDVTFQIKWSSADAFDVFGFYAAVVDANNFLIAGSGWLDGTDEANAGGGYSKVRSGGCPGDDNTDDATGGSPALAIDTFYPFRILRKNGMITVFANGVEAIRDVAGLYAVDSVALVLVHHATTTTFTFGTVAIDSVSGWYEV